MADRSRAPSASTSAARASRRSSSAPTARPVTERLRVDTPRPATPKAAHQGDRRTRRTAGRFRPRLRRLSRGRAQGRRRDGAQPPPELDRREHRRVADQGARQARARGQRRRRAGAGRRARRGRRARHHARHRVRVLPLRRRAPRPERAARPPCRLEQEDVRGRARQRALEEGRQEEVEQAASARPSRRSPSSSTTTGSTSAAATPRRSRSTCRRTCKIVSNVEGLLGASRSGTARRTAMASADAAAKPASPSDALVFFGATGDLAYKKIFPSLQGMVRRGILSVPVIGVAKSGWSIEQLRDRARASLKEYGGGVDEAAFAKLVLAAPVRRRRLRRPGHVREAAQGSRRGAGTRRTTSRSRRASSATVVEQLGKSGCAEGARVVIEKPFGHDFATARAAQPDPPHRFPEPSRLPHRPLPRQGGGREPPLLPVRQHVPRADLEPQLRGLRADHDGRGVRRAGARQVLRRDRARSATSSRTTSSRSSATSRWSRRSRSTRTGSATSRSRSSARSAR